MSQTASRFRGLMLAVLLLFFGIGDAIGQSSLVPTDRENYQCDEERDLIPKLARMAGETSIESGLVRFHRYWTNTDVVSVTAGDNRQLRGYRLRSGDEGQKDVLLVIQGNAWRADQFAKYAALFASNQFDVYVFDFRGYGISTPGQATLGGVIQDYVEILHWLSTKSESIYIYSFSGGGVIALNAARKHGIARITKLVLDATPTKLETFGLGCLSTYDPINHIPADECESVAVLRGTRDLVVHKKNSIGLANSVEECGGSVLSKFRGHPFQLEMPWTRKSRVRDVLKLLRAD